MKKSRRKRQSLVVQDGSISHTVSQMEAKKEAFLKAVVQAGSISLAAHAVGIDRRTHYYWKERDPEYFEKFKDATAEYREHLCENIETEIYRRGHDGVDKPVYQGGKRVGTVREYSDLVIDLPREGRDAGEVP